MESMEPALESLREQRMPALTVNEVNCSAVN